MSETLDVASFSLRLSSVSLPFGLVLDEVRLTGSGLHAVREPFSLTLAKPGSLEAEVGAAALTAFLNAKAPGGLRNLTARLSDGQIHVTGSLRMIFEVSASASCGLRIVDGKQLWVDLNTVDVMGVGARNLVQTQLDSINPVLDLRDLPIPVEGTLTSVEITSERVLITGQVTPKLNG